MTETEPDVHRIIDLVREVCLVPAREHIEADTNLILNGMLDSIGVVDLSAKLQECFALQLASRDINPRNFRTVKHILELVRASQGR